MGNGLSDQTSILSSLPSFQSFHIVILGLDCAGKTTVLYRLQFNEFVNTVPTKGFNTEKIKPLSEQLLKVAPHHQRASLPQSMRATKFCISERKKKQESGLLPLERNESNILAACCFTE
ncbi:ADP-ribosylation factor-like protein 4A isoform X3 [Piliocolobus tephrosceles]|uniref:ADP-ribosylation factor-like protein 4A isoform X3 n=1 Tax=Piliocolobus tephrosceles TaxID=591936 RepID=UPI000C2A50C4|nr:ADP-ribosylation factor-like protein 4A isoform X3 [Piliocolobus tephrosceles]